MLKCKIEEQLEKAVKPGKTKDFDLRSAICQQLVAEGLHRCNIRHELTLDSSSSGGRADIVIFTLGGIFGIEIKSGSDVLDRCADQRDAYEHAFDGCHFIVDARHKENIQHSYTLYFPDQKKFAYRADMGSLELIPEIVSSHSSDTSPAAMIRLLWCDEAVRVAASFGYRCKTRWDSIKWLRENVSLKDLRPKIIAELRARVHSKWEESFWKRHDAQGLICQKTTPTTT